MLFGYIPKNAYNDKIKNFINKDKDCQQALKEYEDLMVIGIDASLVEGVVDEEDIVKSICNTINNFIYDTTDVEGDKKYKLVYKLISRVGWDTIYVIFPKYVQL